MPIIYIRLLCRHTVYSTYTIYSKLPRRPVLVLYKNNKTDFKCLFISAANTSATTEACGHTGKSVTLSITIPLYPSITITPSLFPSISLSIYLSEAMSAQNTINNTPFVVRNTIAAHSEHGRP